jgi:hypothetical protein
MTVHRYVGPEFPLLTIPAFSQWELLDLEVPQYDSIAEGSTLL